MIKELEVPADWLDPPLLDGREQGLIEDYLKLIVLKMDEWTANLMKTEVAEFIAREQPPEVDADGQYGMQGAVILFQMLNQQIDLALDSNQGQILARVVEDANRVMRGVQSQWLKLIDAEFKKLVEAKNPDDVPGGLVEYVMALANDQIKSADFTEALNLRLEPLVSSKYKIVIADKLNDAMDGYLDVAKRCVQVLIDAVFNDLKTATKKVFQPAWYTDDPMVQIIETLKDYMVEDYQTHLNPNLFDLLIEDMIDAFLVAYLVAIRKASKIRVPQAVDRMRHDIDKAKEFFKIYKSKKELESYFDVLESVLTLISASKMMVFLDVSPASATSDSHSLLIRLSLWLGHALDNSTGPSAKSTAPTSHSSKLCSRRVTTWTARLSTSRWRASEERVSGWNDSTFSYRAGRTIKLTRYSMLSVGRGRRRARNAFHLHASPSKVNDSLASSYTPYL